MTWYEELQSESIKKCVEMLYVDPTLPTQCGNSAMLYRSLHYNGTGKIKSHFEAFCRDQAAFSSQTHICTRRYKEQVSSNKQLFSHAERKASIFLREPGLQRVFVLSVMDIHPSDKQWPPHQQVLLNLSPFSLSPIPLFLWGFPLEKSWAGNHLLAVVPQHPTLSTAG